MRCPIFTLAWTPEGRRLVTGASSGEFTLWNGLTFNFETILQVRHNLSVYLSSCLISVIITGARYSSEDYGVVAQRQLDGNG